MLSIISKVELSTVDANTVEDSHVPNKIKLSYLHYSRRLAQCIFILNDKLMAQRVHIAIDSRTWVSEFKHLTMPPPYISGVSGTLMGFL